MANSKIETEVVPLGNRTLVHQLEALQQSRGGIWIPQATQQRERLNEGEVLAVGPDRTDIKVGDVVVFLKNAGTPIGEERDRLWLLEEPHVVAVRRPKETPAG